ncbi:MAG: hypothetical protein H0U97_01945 [Gammaproteobacteria bacterium]|nr:hypothetical protein [Gammaproteobacteria bacterium]
MGERRAQPEQVTEEVFEEARRRDPEGKRPRAMLIDGHEGQLGDIQAEIDRSEAKITLIVDFIHVLEYLSKAAWRFFALGDEAAGSGRYASSRARPAMWAQACGAVSPCAIFSG